MTEPFSFGDCLQRDFVVPIDPRKCGGVEIGWAMSALWSNAKRVPVTRVEVLKRSLTFRVMLLPHVNVADAELLRAEIESVLN